jgi:phage terminase Nu1 subunit (DNA packaging protein)
LINIVSKWGKWKTLGTSEPSSCGGRGQREVFLVTENFFHFHFRFEVIFLDKNVNEIVCSTNELAAVLGVSDRWVRELAQGKILEQASRGHFHLVESVQKYIEFIKEGESSGNDKDQKHNYRKEKTLLTKANREKAEIELAIIRGEVHRTEDVETIVSNMLNNFRSKILAIPVKVSPYLLAQTEMAIIQDILKTHLYEALTELKDYDPEAFHRQNKECLKGKIKHEKRGKEP